MAPGQIIAIGCESCDSNKGLINFYDARSLTDVNTESLIYELKGDNDH